MIHSYQNAGSHQERDRKGKQTAWFFFDYKPARMRTIEKYSRALRENILDGFGKCVGKRVILRAAVH